MLRKTPFDSYLLPGLTLAVMVGASAAVAAVAMLIRPQIGGLDSVVAGMIMMGWIVGEFLSLSQSSAPAWTEALYFVLGLMTVALGLMIE